jgi:hypothetical protein
MILQELEAITEAQKQQLRECEKADSSDHDDQGLTSGYAHALVAPVHN